MSQFNELKTLATLIENNSVIPSVDRKRIAQLLGLLDLIHEELDGVEWNSDTGYNIASYMEAQGLEIKPFDPEEAE